MCPLKPHFLDDSRGVTGKNLNPYFPKLTFIADLGNFFRKFAQNFPKRRIRHRFWNFQARIGQNNPQIKFWASQSPPEDSDGNWEGGRKTVKLTLDWSIVLTINSARKDLKHANSINLEKYGKLVMMILF